MPETDIIAAGPGGAGRLLVTGAWVLAADPAGWDRAGWDRPEPADILIEDGRIAAIAPGLDAQLPADGVTRLDATDHLAVPGLVNAHYHSHDVLLKGAFEAIPLDLWSALALPPAYRPRSLAEIRVRTALGAAECLMRGITTLQDMPRLHPFSPEALDAVLDTYDAVGIRAVVSPHFNDLPHSNSAAFWDEELPAEEQWRLSGGMPTYPPGTDLAALMAEVVPPCIGRHARITLGLGPSAPERCSPELLRGVARLADAHGLQVFTHVAESRGKTLHARLHMAAHDRSHIRYLQDCGLLGPHVTLAHAIWLEDDEIARIADSGAHVVLNVLGNLKTRSGIAPIAGYRRAGAALALGCDNCGCNDAQSLLQTMKVFAGLGAVSEPLGDGPTAAETLHAATLGGAAAVGLGGVTGCLEVGRRADLVLFDLADPGFVPLNSAVRQLVFGDSATAVRTVLVDGRVVVRDGRLLTVDMARLRADAENFAEALRAELDEIRQRVDPLMPHVRRAAERAQAAPWTRDCGCGD